METHQYKIRIDNSAYNLAESDLNKIDLFKINDNTYHSIFNNKSTIIEIQESDFNKKYYKIEIEGEIFELEINTPLELEINQLGFENRNSKKITNIKAPMPGLVLEILVKNGDAILNGETLVVLEAMKMENSIKIQADGVIANVLIKKGQAVEKGQILIELL